MLNTPQISRLLRPGLRSVFGDYEQHPANWKEIYKSSPSDKAVEYDVEVRFTGLGQIRPEGGATAVDPGPGQRITTSYVHKYVALGFHVTRQAMKDNLYKDEFPKMAKSLRFSLAQSKEILGANVLINAFSDNFPLGDGQPLCSTAHPIDTGVYANTFTNPVDLNEASLEAALIAIEQFQNQAGLKINTKAKKMIVPSTGRYVCDRLLSSAFRTNSNTNDISSVYNQNSVPEGFRVNVFLPLTNAWYLLTDAENGFNMFVRENIETDITTDPYTDNLFCKAVERYSFGCSNPRAVFGVFGP